MRGKGSKLAILSLSYAMRFSQERARPRLLVNPGIGKTRKKSPAHELTREIHASPCGKIKNPSHKAPLKNKDPEEQEFFQNKPQRPLKRPAKKLQDAEEIVFSFPKRFSNSEQGAFRPASSSRLARSTHPSRRTERVKTLTSAGPKESS